MSTASTARKRQLANFRSSHRNGSILPAIGGYPYCTRGEGLAFIPRCIRIPNAHIGSVGRATGSCCMRGMQRASADTR